MEKPCFGGLREIEREIESDLVIPWDGLARLREDLEDLSDESLLGLVKGGSADAYAVLFDRYRHPAHRLAAYYSNSVDAKDIAAETFAQVYDLLRRGKGPLTSFRAYLFTSIRHEAGRRAKMRKRITPTDVIDTVDKPVLFGDGAIDRFERELVRDAFASLPTRWQTVLWHLDVEGRKPREVAPLMGLKPNGISALAYRARDGLRKAYLEQHISKRDRSLPVACRSVRRDLVDVVRGSATKRDAAAADIHLESCTSCTGVHLELSELNSHLSAQAA
jgi:RNA polymerase sigma factor (sigma-70 family)